MPLLSSLQFALRSLRRAPGFTAVSVLTLALGVGATSSIFSVINGSQLAVLPWGDSDSIVSIDVHRPKHDKELRDSSPGQFRDFQRESRSYSGLVAIQWERAYLTDRDETLMVQAPRVTANGFDVVRVRPLVGRAFEEKDGRPGAEPVAMMSERLWGERYGAAPDVVGRQIQIDGVPTTIIGIVATAHWFPNPSAGIVRPLAFGSETPSRSGDRLGVVGRLAPNVTVAQAQAEIDALAERLAQRYPATDADVGLTVQRTRDTILGSRSKAANVLLLGAVGFLLLIVCANLAGLLLARGAAREKELATRSALGATRAQIVGHLLSECTAIALLALPLSVLITRLCLDYMLSLVPDTISYMDQIFRLDASVLTFAALTMAATVLLFGLYPALKATRFDLNSSLKDGGQRGSSEGGSQHMRSILVIAQIALAVSLLATSSLFMRAFVKVQTVQPGFDTSGVIVAGVVLPDARYRDPDSMRAFQRRLEDSVTELPGGSSAALTSAAPLGPDGPWREFQIDGRRTTAREEPPRARWSGVSPHYFTTLGLRMLAGRTFSAQDGASSQPVVLVTRSFAERYFPGESAVGRRIELMRASGSVVLSTGSREIVGVVSDFKSFPGLEAPSDQPRIYEPIAQQPVPEFQLVVRASEGTQAIGELLRQRVREIDPLLGVTHVETMETRFERLLWQSTFFIRMMTTLGILALALAAIGVYGVVSYTTARRTREFGIRTALGAEPAHIAGLVLHKTIVLGVWGSVIGVALALLWAKASERVLYDSAGLDPSTLAGVLLALLLVMLAATAVPTLRAVRVQPADCLRTE